MGLKSKVSRLRDWNFKFIHGEVPLCELEIKSISITRLKPFAESFDTGAWFCLKSKVSRLRDWNLTSEGIIRDWADDLKSKVSRLRDWNTNRSSVPSAVWRLEIKSISITRLKRRSVCYHIKIYFSWNQKYLDYEIETILRSRTTGRWVLTWNQKYLDYEIETYNSFVYPFNITFLEIKSISITRLKSRKHSVGFYILTSLEIKSISITRLKRVATHPEMWRVAYILKSKVSRLRDWNPYMCWTRITWSTPSWNQKYLDYEIETLKSTCHTCAGKLWRPLLSR